MGVMGLRGIGFLCDITEGCFCDITEGCLCPLPSFRFAAFVLRHLAIGCIQIRGEHVRTNNGLNEMANPASANDRMQAVINLLVESNGEFLLQFCLLYV